MQALLDPIESVNVVPRDSIEEFASFVQAGIDSWLSAGELLVRMTDLDPGVYAKIRAHHPEISLNMLFAFESIGRRKLYPPLLADTTVAGRAMMELPYDQQKKYFHEPIEVVVAVRNGEVITKPKRIHEMSRREVAIVFNGGSVRTKEAQAERLIEIESFLRAPVNPPSPTKLASVELGHFIITLGEDGEPRIHKAPAAFPNATSVRLVPYGSGHKAVVALSILGSPK